MNIEKILNMLTTSPTPLVNRLRTPITVVIMFIVAFFIGVKYAQPTQELNAKLNSPRALSVSDPLLLVKLTTLCPQLPPELLEIALMFAESPDQQTAADKLNNFEMPKSSTSSDWIKQAPSPFSPPPEDDENKKNNE